MKAIIDGRIFEVKAMKAREVKLKIYGHDTIQKQILVSYNKENYQDGKFTETTEHAVWVDEDAIIND